MAFTPAIIQYLDVKKEHEDCILFFRMGDFYETFFEDAKIVSGALNIRLTSRDKNSSNPIPMCGVPIHAIETYLSKLVSSSFSCVLISQVEKFLTFLSPLYSLTIFSNSYLENNVCISFSKHFVLNMLLILRTY